MFGSPNRQQMQEDLIRSLPQTEIDNFIEDDIIRDEVEMDPIDVSNPAILINLIPDVRGDEATASDLLQTEGNYINI